MTAPGTRIRALAMRAFSATTMERVVDPAIADLQLEYSSACPPASRFRRACILVCGYVALFRALGGCALELAATSAYTWISAERWTVGRMLSSVVAFTYINALFMDLPFVFMYGRGIASPAGWLALCLMPQPPSLPS